MPLPTLEGLTSGLNGDALMKLLGNLGNLQNFQLNKVGRKLHPPPTRAAGVTL